ncbi:uncharacterized protein LOC6606705 [Drosophila sechellia]|uniref:GM24009 n=1 Tax=Drosophila sechellia TaxID=7238 RepID=B4HHF1_DROSE|nr:uncharacterized protein LOC6606705 [Drosophila sechellia]EDW42490.1 GM24009 [Drosophila sechellia]
MRFVFVFVLLSVLALSLVSAKEQSKTSSSPGRNNVGATVNPRLRPKRNILFSRPTIRGQVQRFIYGYPYHNGIPTYYKYPYYGYFRI